jgi:hypothetical protein
MKIVPELKDTQSGFPVPIRPEDTEAENFYILSNSNRQESKGSRWIIPPEEPIELLFFRQIFTELRKQCGQEPDGEGDDDIPLAMFQRTFERLFYILSDNQGDPFDAQEVDKNRNGFIGWGEFALVFNHRALKLKFSIPERIYITLDNPDSSMLATILSALVLATIMLSSVCFILSTAPEFQKEPVGELKPEPLDIFNAMENICLVIFVLEYFSRLFTCWAVRSEILDMKSLLKMVVGADTIKPTYPVGRTITFLFGLSNMIDLIAILPGIVGWIALAIDPDGGGLEGGGFVVLRLVRLTRIFRAFKNPKLVEPVIVIARTITNSTKALYVLGFNLLLGILIFGSLMYLSERGEWDPEQRKYCRFIGSEYNTTSGMWDEIVEESPFSSIPRAFWWAVVTATTVGYGDMFPTRTMGFLIGSVTMVFSLVILALPVGVIGGNFSSAWAAYEEEMLNQKAEREKDKRYITAAIQRIEPFEMSKLMLIEVWNERCPVDRICAGDQHVMGPPRDLISRPDAGEFMGMVNLRLELPPDSTTVQTHTLRLRPHSGPAGDKQNVTGTITVQYEWTPLPRVQRLDGSASAADGSSSSLDGSSSALDDGKGDPEVIALQGKLKVTAIRAENLVNLAYVRGRKAYSNPYIMVFLYPNSPVIGESLVPSAWRSPCDVNTLTPVWGASNTWHFLWMEPPSETPPPSPRPRASPRLEEQQSSQNEDCAQVHPEPHAVDTVATDCVQVHPEPNAVDTVATGQEVKSRAQIDEVLEEVRRLSRDVSQIRDEIRLVGERVLPTAETPENTVEPFAPPRSVP